MNGPFPCTGDLEVLRGRAFVLKEGVDYRVKVSFKVRWAHSALLPSHPGVPLPWDPCSPWVLFPHVPAARGPFLHPWVPAALASLTPRVSVPLACLAPTPHPESPCPSGGPCPPGNPCCLHH